MDPETFSSSPPARLNLPTPGTADRFAVEGHLAVAACEEKSLLAYLTENGGSLRRAEAAPAADDVDWRIAIVTPVLRPPSVAVAGLEGRASWPVACVRDGMTVAAAAAEAVLQPAGVPI